MKLIQKRSSSRVAWTVLIALVVLAALPALAQTYEAANAVNLREGPGNEFAVIRALEPGEKVEKIGASGGFLQVRTQGGKEGYVWGTYMRLLVDDDNKVPAFDDFVSDLSESTESKNRPGPGLYYFESVLEFLRIEDHAAYVIGLPLLVAVMLGAAGGFLLRKAYPRLDLVIPRQIAARRRLAVKAAFMAVGVYVLAKAVLYFVDLSLHFATLEEDTAYAFILIAPRVVLAGPVAVVDFLARNWVAGAAVLLLCVLFMWPGFGVQSYGSVLANMDTMPRSPIPAPEPDDQEQAPESGEKGD